MPPENAATEPEAAPDDPSAGSGAGTAGGHELVRWFTDVFAPVINRNVDGGTLVWCPQWWTHPEAVARLTALHEAWTVLIEDKDAPGDGASTWWLQHVDPHLNVLLSVNRGPFSRCTRGHKDPTGLPLDAPENGVPVPAAARGSVPVPEAAAEAALLDDQP